MRLPTAPRYVADPLPAPACTTAWSPWSTAATRARPRPSGPSRSPPPSMTSASSPSPTSCSRPTPPRARPRPAGRPSTAWCATRPTSPPGPTRSWSCSTATTATVAPRDGDDECLRRADGHQHAARAPASPPRRTPKGYVYLQETLAAQGYVERQPLRQRGQLPRRLHPRAHRAPPRAPAALARSRPRTLAPSTQALLGPRRPRRVALVGHSRGGEAVAAGPEALAGDARSPGSRWPRSSLSAPPTTTTTRPPACRTWPSFPAATPTSAPAGRADGYDRALRHEGDGEMRGARALRGHQPQLLQHRVALRRQGVVLHSDIGLPLRPAPLVRGPAGRARRRLRRRRPRPQPPRRRVDRDRRLHPRHPHRVHRRLHARLRPGLHREHPAGPGPLRLAAPQPLRPRARARRPRPRLERRRRALRLPRGRLRRVGLPRPLAPPRVARGGAHQRADPTPNDLEVRLVDADGHRASARVSEVTTVPHLYRSQYARAVLQTARFALAGMAARATPPLDLRRLRAVDSRPPRCPGGRCWSRTWSSPSRGLTHSGGVALASV